MRKRPNGDGFRILSRSVQVFTIVTVALFLAGATQGVMFDAGVYGAWPEYHYSDDPLRIAVDSGIVSLLLSWPAPFFVSIVSAIRDIHNRRSN